MKKRKIILPGFWNRLGGGKGLFTTIQIAKKMKFNLKIAGVGKNQNITEEIKRLCDNKMSMLGRKMAQKKQDFYRTLKR